MTPAADIINAFPAGRQGDATVLVFEYMAATLAEAGRLAPGGIGELPPVIQRECRNLAAVYRPPGALLVAYAGGQPIGCAGLAPHPPEHTAEIKRLYVRSGHRGRGTAHTLMSHAHHHAAEHGITRIILDVLPAGTDVIGFYHRLGYTDAEPYATESPVPMIYMQRLITRDDIHPTHRS